MRVRRHNLKITAKIAVGLFVACMLFGVCTCSRGRHFEAAGFHWRLPPGWDGAAAEREDLAYFDLTDVTDQASLAANFGLEAMRSGMHAGDGITGPALEEGNGWILLYSLTNRQAATVSNRNQWAMELIDTEITYQLDLGNQGRTHGVRQSANTRYLYHAYIDTEHELLLFGAGIWNDDPEHPVLIFLARVRSVDDLDDEYTNLIRCVESVEYRE